MSQETKKISFVYVHLSWCRFPKLLMTIVIVLKMLPSPDSLVLFCHNTAISAKINIMWAVALALCVYVYPYISLPYVYCGLCCSIFINSYFYSKPCWFQSLAGKSWVQSKHHWEEQWEDGQLRKGAASLENRLLMSGKSQTSYLSPHWPFHFQIPRPLSLIGSTLRFDKLDQAETRSLLTCFLHIMRTIADGKETFLIKVLFRDIFEFQSLMAVGWFLLETLIAYWQRAPSPEVSDFFSILE